MASSLSKESQENMSVEADSKLMFSEYAISLEPVVKEKYKERLSLIRIDPSLIPLQKNLSQNVCLLLKPVIRLS